MFQFELKELKRRKEEDESRKRQEEIEKATPVRHHTERSEGERAESTSIKSGSEYIIDTYRVTLFYNKNDDYFSQYRQ